MLGTADCLAQPAYAVEMTVTERKTVGSGELVTHVFTIHNHGTNIDVYSLELGVPDGWPVLPVPGSLFVPTGESAVVFVNLVVPRTAEAGEYLIYLKAISQDAPAVESEAVGSIYVRTQWQFELNWVNQPSRGQPGEWLEGSVRVSNMGNAADEYLVHMEANSSWEVNLRPNEFSLLPGETQVVQFFVRVPDYAAAKAPYSLAIYVSSMGDPLNEAQLVLSNQLGPPLPHLVRGSIYPDWSVSTTFSIDCSANPTLALRGWGHIEPMGYIDMSGTVSMAGILNPRLWIDTGLWSLHVDGGTIASKFASISGMPMIGGSIGEQGIWRALYTEEDRGFTGLWITDCSSLRVSIGDDQVQGLSFEEVDATCDFSRSLSAHFLMNSATQTESGTVWGLGGELSFEGCGVWDISADFLEVSQGYPNQSPRTELGFSGSHRGCHPIFDVDFSIIETLYGAAPNEYVVLARGFDVAFKPILGDIISVGIDVGFGQEESDDAPQTLDSFSESFAIRLDGKTPFLWDFSYVVKTTSDEIAGTKLLLQDTSFGSAIPFGPLTFSAGFDAQLLDDGVTTSFLSGGSIGLIMDYEPTVRVFLDAGGGKASLRANIEWKLASGGHVRWTGEMASCGAPKWATSVSATFPSVFTCCGPSKGRVSGYVFLDVNADGVLDQDEPGVQGILLRADGEEAVSGSDGWFVFPPFEPGQYVLDIDSLPSGMIPGLSLPISTRVSQGDELQILIPLQQRSWLRGMIFNDVNQNGIRDSSESGIPSVRVQIIGSDVAEWITTDANGRFMLLLPPGSYSAELDPLSLPARYETTTVGNVALSLDQYGVVDLSFGAYRRPREVVVTFGPPSVDFSISPVSPSSGNEAILTAYATSPMGAAIVSYEWEFSRNGTAILRSGEQIRMTFPTAGTWQARLVVTDSNGLRGIRERSVPVQ
ncbi:SdrD B-like domain-containing protein [Candidatus Bipolaricaulota bacterium]